MILLVLLIIVILLYYKIYKQFNHWRDRGVKQSEHGFPFFGDYNPLTGSGSFFDTMQKLWNMFPDDRYFGIYLAFTPALIIKDPELIKQITVKHFDHFTNHRPFIPEGIDPLWNRNIVSLKGNDWRMMRATLSPSFTSSKMRLIFSVMSECAENYLDHFLQDGKILTLEMKDVLTRYTNDVTAAVSFGIKCDSINDRNNKFYCIGKSISNSFFSTLNFIMYACPSLNKLFKIQLFPEDVHDFILNLVKDVKNVRLQNGIKRPDMMQLLLEASKFDTQSLNIESGNEIETGFATAIESTVNTQYRTKTQNLTDIDIAAQVLIFFGAGFESVAALMSFMAYEIAVNPNVQLKLQEEIDNTLNFCNRKLTYEELMKMKYMDMVVCETLRKYPSGVAIDRVCTKPYTIQPIHPDEKPLHLKIGDSVMVPIGPVHYDPYNFPNPHSFDPERFSDENISNIKSYTYIPFGMGPRNCIGSRFALLEAKTVFFHLLSKYDLLTNERTEIPLNMDQLCFNLVPKNGVWVTLQPRNMAHLNEKVVSS